MIDIAITVAKNGAAPIYQQVYEQLRDAILTGVFSPGDKLPPIRTFATRLNIGRNTVDKAYRQLQVEGYVESRQGSGFIVQPIAQDALLATLSGTEAQRPLTEPEAQQFPYDFRYGNLRAGLFPAEQWRRIQNEVLGTADLSQLGSYTNPRGEVGLRQEIAQYLQKERGIECTAEQIIMTSGTQQSLVILLHLLNPRTDHVATENPGYPGAHAIFKYSGFQIDAIRTDLGPEVYLDDVCRSTAKLIYTTPAHQFPMGSCMDMNTRLKLLQHAQETDAYIVEDNYDSEFRYNSKPVPPLQSIDQHGRVIYLGTFSKALSPALRLGYMVMPKQLVEEYNTLLAGWRTTVPWLEQECMRLFMARGLWKQHLRRANIANRKLHATLVEALNTTFEPGQITLYQGEAGLFVLLGVNNPMNQDELLASAAELGVGLSPTSNYWLDSSTAPQRLVLISFSAADSQTIKAGIPLLKEAWF